MAELSRILKLEVIFLKPILWLYTDGGPDYRSTYLSVQAPVGLFLKRWYDLDLLVAAGPAPMNSYRIPAERSMSLLNIVLQGVGMMRQEMSAEMEANSSAAIQRRQFGKPQMVAHH